jgi:hypothetical protein
VHDVSIEERGGEVIWSPAITAVLIGIIVAFSFGGGFALGDWRMASRLERLSSDNALLWAVNDRAAVDLQAARKVVEAKQQNQGKVCW